MITKEQCRAARSLLNLKQAELAEDCGISKTAITNFESGLFNPRADNMAIIETALQNRGIDFIGLSGVQKRQTISRMLEGNSMYPDLWDDIFDTMKDRGGEVLISYLTEKESNELHPEALAQHIDRLKQHRITERLLVCEGDTCFVQDRECYRWLPENVFKAGATTFLYNGKIAIQFWSGSIAMILENESVYQSEKARFEYLWENALIPPDTAA